MEKLLNLYIDHMNKENVAYAIWLRASYENRQADVVEKAWTKWEKESRAKHLVLKLVRFKYGQQDVGDFMHIARIIADERR